MIQRLVGARSEPTLLEVASVLGNSQIDSVVAMFREHKIAAIRSLVLGLVLLWVIVWLRGPQPVLVEDASRVFPWAAGLFAASVAWMVAIRRGWLKVTESVDAIGIVFNYAAIALLCKFAFILLITLNAMLPFITIAVGARYSRRAFAASIAISLLILIWTGPPGYWISRPAYALYAVALTIGLPILIFQILSALRAVSTQALLSRDSQSRFVSQMSHELRTPLQTLINVSGLIDADRLAPGQARLLGLLDANAHVLLRRLNDILDVAAMDGGKLLLSGAPFRPGEIIATVHAVCDPLAQSKGITLAFDAPVDDGLVLFGDARRMEQVVTNLTHNAIKYTREGGSVGVALRYTGGGDGHLTFTVTDNGVGIPAAERQRIFQAFHQASCGDARKHDGVGLGLFIVKSISDQMGGDIQVSDNPGGGTVFRWEVPVSFAPDQATPAPVSVAEVLLQHRATMPSLRCLIIDDSPSNRDILSLMLGRAGHEAIAVEDGLTGLKVLAEEAVDLVLLDLHMPGVSGWDVIRRMRGLTAVPIIVLSADATAGVRERALGQGAAACLAKPVGTHELLYALESFSAAR